MEKGEYGRHGTSLGRRVVVLAALLPTWIWNMVSIET